MYKAVFQNSKVALLFAGMTVISAVSIVGTSEDRGLVSQVADMVEAQRAITAGQGQGGGSGEGAGSESESNSSVFGDYEGDAPTAPAGPASAAGDDTSGGSVMTAPLSSTATVAERGSRNPVPMPETEAEPEIIDSEAMPAPE